MDYQYCLSSLQNIQLNKTGLSSIWPHRKRIMVIYFLPKCTYFTSYVQTEKCPQHSKNKETTGSYFLHHKCHNWSCIKVGSIIFVLCGRSSLTKKVRYVMSTQIARFMWPTWGPPGSCRPQVGPLLAPWTLLSGHCKYIAEICPCPISLPSPSLPP